MKKILTSTAVAAAFSLGAIAPAQAQTSLLSESDVALQDSVKSALMSDSRLKGSILNVSALNGRVSVTGTLKDETQAAAVSRIARGVSGVSSVTTLVDASAG